jgi:subtilase family serine protease
MTIALLNTVKNQGGAAATPSVIKFFLSPNASFDPSDVLLGSRSIPALPPGATNSGSTPVTIPGDAPTGALYIFARADADDAVVETQENNNSTSRSIAVGPDLNVPAFSAPAAAPTGSAISVTDTVKNAGGGMAAATVTRFFLSANGLLDSSDILLGARPVAALAPGATSSGTVSGQIPAGTAAGSYYIIAKADGDNALPETNEGNNTYGRSIQITVSP